MVATQLQTDFSETPTASKTGPYLTLEPAAWQANFPQRPFMIRHYLAGHELFSLPRLIELAQRLPAERVEYNAGNIPVSQDPATTPQNGLSIAETIRRIEECRSWLVLKNVEQDPAYAALLNACLDEIKAFSERSVPGMSKREGYIFITSPDSVTPYHIDNEYNFLLQIRGQKQISLFDRADRSILSELELEKFYTGGHRNLTFKDEYQASAQVFQLTPGDGLHFPITAPHWVKNGPTVSISFSITFRTPASEKREMVFRVNAGLRKFGLTPTPADAVQWQDVLKANAYRAWRRAQTLFRRAA
ncbi:MAG: cupin-like domain-containing protein [Acidobacteria bacterium]|nr:cupin-like domain-containing protein [Acidobacteriota bacterium]MBI3422784.1 cupin-like domain-containing protein [Acidobacteriota bacterium]